MSGRLEGRRALVTGAAQGIGASIACAMRREGAEVYAVDINWDGVRALAAQCGATPIHLDVTSELDWTDFAKRLERSCDGMLSVLVNNAGIEQSKSLRDLSLEEWRRTMAVNVDGMFIACRTLQPHLAAAGTQQSPSSVINLSSVAGLVGWPGQIAYNVSKGAVRHLAKSLAIEWAAHGLNIRCNSIHPGAIRTPLLEEAVDMQVKAGMLQAEHAWKSVAALSPMNTVGEPWDVAMGAVYLASDEARFVTGTELVIDGGVVAR
jgi:NAD(P)-dependent dehydrogenase (short-subunit alcohol dehydrogenase family)